MGRSNSISNLYIFGPLAYLPCLIKINSVARRRCGGKQTVSPLYQWDMVKVWEMQELHSPPPSPPPNNGYGPYGILAVCRINLWPAVRLGQEGWLKQPVAKVRGPIVDNDLGSRRGHHCSETALTG